MTIASKFLERINDQNKVSEKNSLILNEMATVIDKSAGLGIEIRVFSEDHPPAHMHVLDTRTGSLIARVIIPSKKPSNINSIRPYRNETLSNTQKSIILEALNLRNNRTGTAFWKRAIEAWDLLHPDFPA